MEAISGDVSLYSVVYASTKLKSAEKSYLTWAKTVWLSGGVGGFPTIQSHDNS